MERKGPATYDPGWNDPPMFSYESQSTQSKVSKPRTFLNKRVAFPLQASPPANSSPMAIDPTAPLPPCNLSTMPPPPVPLSCVSQPKDRGENPTTSHDDFNSKLALDTVMNNLSSALNSHEFEEKHRADIKRRLDTLQKMWLSEKLGNDVQKRLLALSEALEREDMEKADDLQKGLMVDHAAICSSWMSGVRHLIHHKQPTPETKTD